MNTARMGLLMSLLSVLSVVHAYPKTYVFDADEGLAAITVFDDKRVMMFDTGIADPDLYDDMNKVIGNRIIALLIISTPDREHTGLTDRLVRMHDVRTVIRPGVVFAGGTDHKRAIRDFSELGRLHDIDLSYTSLPRNTRYEFGDTTVHVVQLENEKRNVAVLVQHEITDNACSGTQTDKGWSYKSDPNCSTLLLTGDLTGGRGSATDAERLTRRYVETGLPLKVDVLLAPDYGRDVQSSQDFLLTVKPEKLILTKNVTRRVRKRFEMFDPCMVRVGTHSVVEVEFTGTKPPILKSGKVFSSDKDCKKPVDYSDPPTVPVRKAPNGICYTQSFEYFEDLTPKDSTATATEMNGYATMRECVESGGTDLN